MGRIQRYAEGFLSLVGNKVGGREPTQLSDVVMPMVNMTELLLGRTIAVELDTVAANTNYGASMTLTVPDNEVWLLKGVSWAVLTAAAADRVNIHVYLTNLPESSSPADEAIILADDMLGGGFQVIHTLSRAVTFDTPFVLPAGAQIGYEVIDTNKGTLSWNGKAVVYKLTA